MHLIFAVESLQTQLSEAGRPVNEKLEHIFIQSVTHKPLLERIRKWKARRDHLQKMVDRPGRISFFLKFFLDKISKKTRF
jgi:hypothetical protein